jgi:nucleoside-diphosphate-sugar epimerase
MRIFVTGGSGFVGRATLAHLAKQHEVIAMSRRPECDGFIRSLGAKPLHCELNHVTAEHLSGIDIVIHCAAMVVNWGNREQLWYTNVRGTEQLLETAKTAGVKRFIHISSDAVLFEGHDLINVDERHEYPTLPRTFCYGESKQAAEKAVIQAASESFATLILRPNIVWGYQAQTAMHTTLLSDWPKIKTWVGHRHYQVATTHIKNLVHAIELALTNGQSGQVYFVVDDKPVDLRDFFSRLMSAAKRPSPTNTLPKWLMRSLAQLTEICWQHLGLQSIPPLSRFQICSLSSHFTVDSDKAEIELGYRPIVSTEQGLAQLSST